jgi:D-lactate dehydrogenase (cytochrome)
MSPWPEATVGGIVATNFNAPLRMRYGGIRDLILAMTIVMPDNRIIRLGKPVMKNVAGYDLGKLFVGSYGTLGLVCDVTLRLVPTPEKRATLAVSSDNLTEIIDWGKAVLRTALVASSILVCRTPHRPFLSGEYSLLYTAEGLREDVDAELEEAYRALAEIGAPQPGEVAEGGCDIWAGILRGKDPEEPLLRVGVPPRVFPDFIRGVIDSPGRTDPFVADLPGGLLYVRGDIDVMSVRRAAKNGDGYAVVVAGDPPPGVDPWGHKPDSFPLMRTLKCQWDTSGRFNPGTFEF